MSNDPKLTAQPRESVGTAAAKKLRATGQIPGTIYGHGEGTAHFCVDAEQLEPIVTSGHKVVDFDLGGKQDKAMLQEVQWDTFSKYILHFDLKRVDENERVSTEVELVVRGISPGVLAGGILEQVHHSLPIECPVIRLPDSVSVKINNLQLGESISISDLELPIGVTTTLPPEEVVVHVVEARKAAVTDDAEGGSGEPEVIGASEDEG